MRLLAPEHHAQLARLLPPERPGPLVGPHVLQTGLDACHVDRWPDPRLLLFTAGPNYSLVGDPEAASAASLGNLIAGMVDAPPHFEPLLRSIDPQLGHWDRIISQLLREPAPFDAGDAEVRRLRPRDVRQVSDLSEENRWIWETLGGPVTLCAAREGWGAFEAGRLVSLAVPFFIGQHFEDIGVVTEPDQRGRGLSVACAGALCVDIRARGRIPSWSTSPDNRASLRVAEKLGFEREREDRLFVVKEEVPEAAQAPA
jgi:RimJ/RimL family protein N-acetyltransferase